MSSPSSVKLKFFSRRRSLAIRIISSVILGGLPRLFARPSDIPLLLPDNYRDLYTFVKNAVFFFCMVACMAIDPRLGQIKVLLDRSNKSVRWLAKQVNSTDTTVAHILNGETLNPRDPTIIERMLQALDQVPNIATVGIGAKYLRSIPVYTSIMAGEPGYFDADVEYELIPEWGGDFERWGRVVRGESMMPVLEPGDIAVFENRRHENGSVVHAFKDGEDVVKAYRLIDGKPVLDSFNGDGPSFSAEGWKVKGVCVMRIRTGSYKIRTETTFPGGLSWAMREIKI